eukprot:scaffold145685_cov13-Tisochrysis_lutea.AAC.1
MKCIGKECCDHQQTTCHLSYLQHPFFFVTAQAISSELFSSVKQGRWLDRSLLCPFSQQNSKGCAACSNT